MPAYNFNSSGIKNLPSLSMFVVIISENIDVENHHNPQKKNLNY